MLSYLESERVRYLLAGAWNTAFGYAITVGLYVALSDTLHITLIGAIAHVLAISMAFATYKVFVFRSRGKWLREYLRSYVVYGGTAVVGILLLWLLVDGLHIKIWFAQGALILITVVISYIGHASFTFKDRK
jgi:putative flippase GtrA